MQFESRLHFIDIHDDHCRTNTTISSFYSVLLRFYFSANYLYARLTMKLARELTSEMRDIAFKFNAAMTGVDKAPERWQTCTSAATGTFYHRTACILLKMKITKFEKS